MSDTTDMSFEVVSKFKSCCSYARQSVDGCGSPPSGDRSYGVLKWLLVQFQLRRVLSSKLACAAWFFFCVALVSTPFANAQFAPTTVQLPTVNQFSVGTTVWVPDGGSASLGGVNSYQSGTTSQGVPILGRLPGIGRAFNNQAFGASANANQARVKATIIDLQEMDAQLRNTPEARRVRERMGGFFAGDQLLNGGGLHGGAANLDPTTSRALYLSQNMGRSKVESRVKPSPKKVVKKKTEGAAKKSRSSEPPLFLRKSQ